MLFDEDFMIDLNFPVSHWITILYIASMKYQQNQFATI